MCRGVLFVIGVTIVIRDIEKYIEYTKSAITRSGLCNSINDKIVFVARDYGCALSCGDYYIISRNYDSTLCNAPISYIEADFILMSLQIIRAGLGYGNISIYCSLDVSKCGLESITVNKDEVVVRFE